MYLCPVNNEKKKKAVNISRALALILLPLVSLCYVAWHVWVLLPCSAAWRCLVSVIGIGSLLLLFFDVSGRLDALPLPLARALYNIGTSAPIVLLYLVLLFLVLDLGRLVRLVPKALLYDNAITSVSILVLMVGVFMVVAMDLFVFVAMLAVF